MIRVTCSGCDKAFNVSDHAAGRKGRCKACGAVLTVPQVATADEIEGWLGKPVLDAIEDDDQADEPIRAAVAVATPPPLPTAPVAVTAVVAGEPPAVNRLRWIPWTVAAVLAVVVLVMGLAWPRRAPRLDTVDADATAVTPVEPEKPQRTEPQLDPKLLALIEYVAALHGSSPEGVAAVGAKTVEEMNQDGLALTPAEFYAGSLQWRMPGAFNRAKAKRPEFAEYAGLYVTYRLKTRCSHKETLASLRGVTRLLYAVHESPPEEVFEAAMKTATPGQQFAMVEADDLVDADDPWVQLYDRLASDVATGYKLHPYGVTTSAAVVYGKLRTEDVSVTPDEILEFLLEFRDRRNYQAVAMSYVTFRLDRELTHEQAIEAMRRGQ